MANSRHPTAAYVPVEEDEESIVYRTPVKKNYAGMMFEKLRRKLCEQRQLGVGNYLRPVNNLLFPLSLTSILVFWFIPTVLMFSPLGRFVPDPAFGFASTLAHATTTKEKKNVWLVRVYVYLLYTLMWASFACLLRVLLTFLLRYHAFLYERKTLSRRTKLWAGMLRFLSNYLGGRRTLYSYQGLLPHLPVPSLRSTISRYLQSLRPLLDDAEHQSMITLSEQFINGEGKRFQRYLWLKWLTSPNYVTDWWERYAYLHSRSPLLVNSNYYIMDNHGLSLSFFIRRPASRAANLTHCIFKFRGIVERQELKPLILGDAVPLCSWQHERQFDTTRIPGVEDDVIEHAKVPATHIAVLHRGRWFKLDTHYKGELLAAVDLEAQFEAIMADLSPPYPGEERLASLTAGERTHWAKTRARYFCTSQNGTTNVNGDSLRVIETAAFVVALDDEVAYDYNEKDPTQFDKFAHWLLCGNGANRWCDKNYTLVVMGNGRVGLNVEHSWSDGLISAVLWEYVLYEDAAELGYTPEGRCKGDKRTLAVLPSRLQWSLEGVALDKSGEITKCAVRDPADDFATPSTLMQCIDTAYGVARAIVDDTQLVLFNFDEYGKGFIKTCKVSPDGFVQLILQLAYFRSRGRFDLTYETSMTRLYLHGRTETVRPCTTQSTAFVRSMQPGSLCTNGKRRELLRDACYAHQRQYLDCMNGKGVDRHLFALYIVSKGVSSSQPSPFLESYIKDSSWKLSTSQTPRGLTDRVDENNPLHLSAGGGFGPVTPDGYGVSYVLCGDGLVFFHISSRKSCPTTDSAKFCEQIRIAMRDMKSIYTQPSESTLY